MKTIWSGALARGGRKKEIFNAEIVELDGETALIERRGVEVRKVSAHEICGESWLLALSMLARRLT